MTGAFGRPTPAKQMGENFSPGKTLALGYPHAVARVARFLGPGCLPSTSSLLLGAAPLARLATGTTPWLTYDLYGCTVNTMSATDRLERHHLPDRIRVLALDALADALEAEAFLVTPHPGLGGRAPLDVAMTEHGTHYVEQLLDGLGVKRTA